MKAIKTETKKNHKTLMKPLPLFAFR